MDHNGFQWRTEHFPAIIKTQLDVLRDVIMLIFSLSYVIKSETKIQFLACGDTEKENWRATRLFLKHVP